MGRRRSVSIAPSFDGTRDRTALGRVADAVRLAHHHSIEVIGFLFSRHVTLIESLPIERPDSFESLHKVNGIEPL